MRSGMNLRMARRVPAARGRPREFDVDAALDRALDVFWTRGYEATSLDELAAEMAIARPSLYAAFGNKHALYLRALARYRDGIAEAYRDALRTAPSIRAGIEAFWQAALDRYLGPSRVRDAGARGCFVVGTAVVEAPTDPAIRAALAAILAELDGGFARALALARTRGELAADADLETAARVLAATQHSLAIRARAGTPRGELEELVRGALDLVFGTRDPRPPRSPTVAWRTRRP